MKYAFLGLILLYLFVYVYTGQKNNSFEKYREECKAKGGTVIYTRGSGTTCVDKRVFLMDKY